MRPPRVTLACLALALFASDGAQARRSPRSQLLQPAAPALAEPGPLSLPDSQLEPLEWSELEGWAEDDHASALTTFLASCRPLVRGTASDPRPMRAALVTACRRALSLRHPGTEQARAFFEQNFRAMRISRLGEGAGFLTGYYEPVVDGSRFPTRNFTVPLYRRPPDLVAPGTPVNAAFPNKGPALRVTAKGQQVPYYDRGEIEDGALDGRRLEICWLKDPAEALTIQIQGSARVRLEDGTMLRVNYAAHNGFPYTPVGRLLIERNIVPREEMSMDRIRDWMRAFPEEAKEVRRSNRSFVFFRIVGLDGDREAVGGQGIPLTPWRSIAVDRALHVYGTPFFIAANVPAGATRANVPFRRTMIAQDTGSAIVGPARADLYFGAGEDAGRIAGRIRHAGQFAMLVPRDIDPVAAGARMPLPQARPEPEKPKEIAKTRTERPIRKVRRARGWR
jgi:membrane-bound lytic murein transglycosylase A